MTLDMARDFLGWCALINYGVLIFWVLLIKLARGWMLRQCGRWYHLSVEQFDQINYTGVLFYKTGIIFFSLVPYVVLRILG